MPGWIKADVVVDSESGVRNSLRVSECSSIRTGRTSLGLGFSRQSWGWGG